ncbi:hypothetical protein, variant 7 [Cryptococcus amylolentus CBS 6039]|uniref:RING-type domain-containing protein n=1 Tax=Cryptococcus amylolentus CBS 6039 TaxID=1295533 RepID=A0A1E3HKW7_9TREE|nr:hypothetical protein, variant 4 [Cryptococcus amylolentus CBS 6039]XP_018992376.1 hypothetical protein, variant 5 [Cryptococcus amylolentus CBS 6039]XP_018992377.1 hypothetical protein, variant 6 [Cryptococcus amylolentus CBS 6039]XP_018992378.1 hypothetical protein, variant 7 [Cryptococcus amylolentus CBS 6039]ODN77001.1 hypothetical protein, variant 4 [Cryptococcus amylolentus CBS 6039]ODN77002.1 hypothetical protein, variant 5 [Cryptococcus amylolentus CBS 6039]ODN77003.1 hypothetical p
MTSAIEPDTRGRKRRAETDDGNDSDDSVINLHKSPRYKQGNAKAPIDIDSDDSDDSIIFVPHPVKPTAAGRARGSPLTNNSSSHVGRVIPHSSPPAPLPGPSCSVAPLFAVRPLYDAPQPEVSDTPVKKRKADAVEFPAPDEPAVAGPSNHAAPVAVHAQGPLFFPPSSPHERLPDEEAAQLPPLPPSASPSPPPPADAVPPPHTPSSKPALSNNVPPNPLDPNSILIQVLEILPDIDPEYALKDINTILATGRANGLAEIVVDRALEVQGGYPTVKIDKGKGRSAPEESIEQYKLPDHRAEERKGYQYQDRCLRELEIKFSSIPVGYIRQRFQEANSLLVPAYYVLLEKSRLRPLPYNALLRPRKAKAAVRYSVADDDVGKVAFERELAWLEATIGETQREQDEQDARQRLIDAAVAKGEGIECGCCFGDDIPENMFQCENGHLFCKDCTIRNAETKLGDQSTTITCMDTSDCKCPFPESELRRSLSNKSLSLYHRLKQSKELELAAIEGLESCPSCDFSAIIDNPHEKLFRCINESCGHVTCRKCRRPEHIPKTCEEMDAESKLDRRHAVEDAMSAALIRNCPRCTKPFIKESGCNKIVCSNCRTISCYICRQIIKGYEHFDRNPANYAAPIATARCALWDKDANPDEAAILAARDVATAEARAAAARDGINLEDKDLHVALPDRAPQAGHPYAHPAGAPVRLPGQPMPRPLPLPNMQAPHGPLNLQGPGHDQALLARDEHLRNQAAFQLLRQQRFGLPAPFRPELPIPQNVMPAMLPRPPMMAPQPHPVAAHLDPMVQEMNRLRALRQARGDGGKPGHALLSFCIDI